MGDRVGGPPPTLSLGPREWTKYTPGAGSGSGPVRLAPGPYASLPPDLTDDPKVAQIVSSTYTGHVIMYTNNKVMTIKERSNLPSTACPSFELQLGEPSELCVSIKLPRTNLDKEDLLTHHRVVVNQGGILSVSGQYLWDLALLLEDCTSDNEYRI